MSVTDGARPPLDPSFAHLRQRLEEETERSFRYNRPLALLCVHLGTHATERDTIDATLRRSLRRLTTIGWADADELLVLLPETTSEEARLVANRIGRLLHDSAPGMTITTASCPEDSFDVETLLATARRPAAQGAPPPNRYRTIAIGDRQATVAAPAMHHLFALIERIADAELPVLITGETGSGKELVASALHHWSQRQARPLVVLNCAALPEPLLESELFGYEKGAFTGATTAKPGLLESARGGTLCLDELGDLPPAAQAKLLRVLETKRTLRLGDVRERPIEVRFVGTTNRRLEDDVKAGRFRQDLFFRLRGARLYVPPLRQRGEEIPILAHRFLHEACLRASRPPMTIDGEAIELLQIHAWPGNVRELRNAMDYVAAAACDRQVSVAHLREALAEAADPLPAPLPAQEAVPEISGTRPTFRPIEEEIRELERNRMAAALAATGGNQTRAAELIGMPRRTFVAKLKEYRLTARA